MVVNGARRRVPKCRPRNALVFYVCDACSPSSSPAAERNKKKKQTSPPPSSIQRAQQKKKEADPLCCRVSTRNNLPSGINMRKFIFILAASALLLRANAFQVCDFHWARLCAECTIRISDQVHRSQRCKTTLALPSLVFSIPKLKWIPFDNNNYIERIPINPNEPHEIVNLFFTFHIRGRQIRKLFI